MVGIQLEWLLEGFPCAPSWRISGSIEHDSNGGVPASWGCDMNARATAMKARSGSGAAVVSAIFIRRHISPEDRFALRCVGADDASKPAEEQLYEVGGCRGDHQRDNCNRNDNSRYSPVQRHDASLYT